VLGGRETVTVADYKALRYTMRCINESMRLYPHPPVLLRRANIPDQLPGMRRCLQCCAASIGCSKPQEQRLKPVTHNPRDAMLLGRNAARACSFAAL